jgi:para-nitrobenzyl esterase
MMKYLPTSRLLVCTPRPYLSAFFDGFFQIRSLALLLGLLIPLSGFGQTTPCTEGFGRYVDLIFAESQVSPDIQYGQNMTIGGTSQNLLMDVYDALGDTASRRIPIILAANGAFSGGTRANLAALSRDFAERGYVVFAIDTRPFDLTLGGGTTEAQMLDWLVKSAGDVKAAVRFIKQETANNSNPYRINPNIIFIGGVGTGAMAALHAGMVGPDDNVTAAYQTALDNNDGFEGNSNSIVAFNSDVRGVISYSGALVDADWLDTDDPLLIAFHDDGDPEVPFGAGTFAPGGVSSPLTVEGSSLIAQRAVAESVFHELNTITSSNVHVSYLGGQLGNTTRTTGEFINDVNCNNRFPNVVDCSNDQQPPSITCPGNIAPVDLGSNCQSTLSDYRLFVNASDACDDNLTLEQSPAPETMIQGPQTVTVTVTATDDAGNFANCQYVIPLVDNTPPVAVCPTIPDVIIGTNGIGVLPPNIGQGLSTDNCGTPQESSPGRTFNCSSQLGPQTVTLTANDGTQTATAACSYVVLAGNGACCNETRTALALNAYNCDGVAGNNPGGSGNCIDINGESVIRLFACTNNPFTVAGVEAEIMTNDNYGKLGGGGTIPSPTLNYYDTFADAAAGTNVTTLSTVLARFAASEASNDPQTEFVWVTQSDPGSGCQGEPSLIRLRLTSRPEVSVTTPSPLMLGESIDLFTLVMDNRNTAESWNIYDSDPAVGNPVPVATSPATNGGEPDGTVTFNFSSTTEGTFTFWLEAVNEGSGLYGDDCPEVTSVTITVGDPCDLPVLAPVPTTTICSGSATGIILVQDPTSAQPIDRIRIRKRAESPMDATSFRVIGPGFSMDYESNDLSALSTEIFILEGTTTNGEVIYTVTPIGADDCEGAPIEVRVVVEPPTCATSPVLEPQNVTCGR